jgi:hypothetical protein
LEQVAGMIDKPQKKTILGGFPTYTGRCPAHDDANPSFAVWETPDGWLHFKCQRGCTEDQILSALKMTQDDRRVNDAVPGRPPKPSDTVYTYTDAQGKPVFKKVRYYEWKEKDGCAGWRKSFRQIGMNGEKNLAHLNGQAKVLYNLPNVLNAKQTGETVYLNEGEKACELFDIAGLVATCQPGGAVGDRPESKWLSEHTQTLKGVAKVVIVADRDAVGEAYARYVASQIAGVVGKVEVVQTPLNREKADAFDHFDAGMSVEQFVVRRDLMPERGLKTRKIETFDSKDPEFLIGQHVRLSQLNLLDADGGTGKTTLALAFAAAGSNGFDPLLNKRIKPFRTLYFGYEDEGGDLLAVYKSIGGKDGFLEVYDAPFILNAEGLRLLKETILDGDFKLVVFDALMYYLHGLIKDSADMMGAAKVLSELREVAIETLCAILNLRHTAKATMGKDAASLGIGTVQFRNSHRSQLVMRWHPDRVHKKGLRVVTHEKGSIRTETAAPFAFGQRAGEFYWEPDIENPWEETDARDRIGRTPSKRQDAEEFLRSYFDKTSIALADSVKAAANELGIGYDTLNRARQTLGIQSGRKAGFPDQLYRWWIEPEEEDPFLADE